MKTAIASVAAVGAARAGRPAAVLGCGCLRKIVCALTALAGLAAVPAAAQADAVKRDLFVAGIQMGNAELVAGLFRGQPTAEHPGAMALIRRNLMDGTNTAKRLKLPTTRLESLLKRLPSLGFASMEQEVLSIVAEYQTKLSREVSPLAAAIFVVGIHHSGAEGVAAHVQSFPRKDKPGSAALIRRNAGWLEREARTLGVSVRPVTKVIADLDRGASFPDLLSQLGAIRLLWQKELEAQPGFASSATGAGAVTKGALTTADPTNGPRS